MCASDLSYASVAIHYLGKIDSTTTPPLRCELIYEQSKNSITALRTNYVSLEVFTHLGGILVNYCLTAVVET